jgi:hypothetical protein
MADDRPMPDLAADLLAVLTSPTSSSSSWGLSRSSIPAGRGGFGAGSSASPTCSPSTSWWRGPSCSSWLTRDRTAARGIVPPAAILQEQPDAQPQTAVAGIDLSGFAINVNRIGPSLISNRVLGVAEAGFELTTGSDVTLAAGYRFGCGPPLRYSGSPGWPISGPVVTIV